MSRNTRACLLLPLLLTVFAAQAGAREIGLDVLIERHVDALGGRLAIDGIHSIVSTGEIRIESTGMSGSIRTTLLMPCLSLTEAELGLFRVTQGFDGERSWMVGPNGMLQIQKDEDSRRRQATTCLLESFGYLSKGDGFTLEYSGTAEFDSVEQYVVKLVPVDGYACRLYIDPRSYLISAMEIESLTGTVEQRFSDFRDTGGVMMPWKTVTTQRAAGQTLIVTLTGVEVNVEIDPAVFLPPGGLTDDFTFINGADSASIEFSYTNRHIYLPVRFEGSGPERLFLLDSGAGMTMIDEALADSMHLEAGGRIPGAGAGGMTDFSMTRIPGFRAGDIEFEEQTAIIYPISGLTGRYSGIEAGGVLGYDFLSRFVTRIDYGRDMITFFRPGSQPAVEEGDTLQAPLVHKIFSVTAVLDGKHEGMFLLDTGANSSVIQRSFADRFGLLDGRKTAEIAVAGAGGEDRAALARFRSLRIGDTRIDGPVFTIPLGGRGIGAFEGIAGVIGNDILERFTLWLDYGAQLAVLRPDTSNAGPVWPDLSGLQIAGDGSGGLVVRSVVPGSPACGAGIRPGDTLVSAGGIEAKETAAAEILSLFRGEKGDSLEIEFERDGKKMSAVLDLEPYI